VDGEVSEEAGEARRQGPQEGIQASDEELKELIAWLQEQK
jgi:hypothetical protein